MFYTIRTKKPNGLCWFISFMNIVLISEKH